MPGRDLSSRVLARRQRRARPLLAAGAVALLLIVIGIVIGSRIGSRRVTTAPAAGAATATVTVERGRSSAVAAAPARTAAGAAAAAARSITAFGGGVLFDPVRLRLLVSRIAAASARPRLIAAFSEASAQTRAKLGADTVPRPVIILRATPLGYQVERFSRDQATVSVWYVGIVASGATVAPQQSWRTQLVTLVWERGGWKVSSYASSSGPTPALATDQSEHGPGELFTAIPRFQEFSRVLP